MREINIDLLRTLLRYDPETGLLFWLPREVSLFEATKNKTAEALCRWWNKRFANKEAFTASGPHGCRHGKIFGTLYYAHRIAWALHYGIWPEEVDHRNGERGDNRIRNLRDVSHQVNMQNKRLYKSNATGVHGVTFHKGMGMFQAKITVNGAVNHIGTFKTKKAAIAARKNAERDYGFHFNHGRAA